MSKKPYVAPELVTLGDVVTVTQATNVPSNTLDFVYNANDPNFPDDGFAFTDNVIAP